MVEGARGLKAPDVCMLLWVLAVWGQLGERYVLGMMSALMEPLRTPEVRGGCGGRLWVGICAKDLCEAYVLGNLGKMRATGCM